MRYENGVLKMTDGEKAEALNSAAKAIRFAIMEIEDVSRASNGATVQLLNVVELRRIASQADEPADNHQAAADLEEE